MPASILISAAALYAAIYYLIGRSALRDLRLVDPEYYRYLGGAPGTSPRNSVALAEIMFDSRCPKDFYPVGVKRKLAAARALLYLSPVVLIAVIVLL
jgi:hypothetical protein